MTIALDILTAIGLACACGVRPFAPTLVFGLMAALNAVVDVSGTDQAFLESPAWLAVIAVLLVLSLVLHRALAAPTAARGVAVAGCILGGLLFVGALATDDAASWAWVAAGVVVAAFAHWAVADTLNGARERVGSGDIGFPVYVELAAALAAALAIVAPPVSIVYVAFLVRLLLARRRRDGEKYAGLRTLR